MSTLTALEEIVDRHGRAALSDPIVLTGALRSLPVPPTDAEIGALTAAAAAGAPDRMRAVLENAGSSDDARRAAVAACGGGGAAEWACGQLGAALGYLPRDTSAANAPTTELTSVLNSGNPRRGRRIAVVAGAAVVVAALATTGVTLALGGGGENNADGPPVAPSTTAPLSTAPLSTAPAPPSESQAAPEVPDPSAAFTDPQLLAAAKPYLGNPGVRCETAEAGVGVQESVTCELGSGIIASFRKLLDPGQLDALREVLLTDNDGARPGSIRSLRWEYVPGQPGVRAGIPVGTPRTGDGTRIRFLEPEEGFARLYFDEDATGVAVYMQASSSEQQALRAFWADPDA
ncbi:hypothetical protein [Amycolatopsis sp. YIM 10]|uniref:hypothetical protein n=1 Tax=Amycolatopsis sp. YIM 10 TaxID=2653857 RepID=UPI00128FF19C|nr:hypothetical protein [Amycolatopsis sp. YIM 10]QFU89836.1 hypothetical protein YIM_23295 [Amycolatopsis sp. YIM 10]